MTDEVFVVVGTFDTGESDRIVRTLSGRRGRISAIARRARASKKRFAGHFEVGNRLRLELRRGRGDLAVIVDADLLSTPTAARADIDRLALLAYGCELCAALAPEEHEAERLARLLEVWIELLEGEGTPSTASRLALEAKALTFAGLAPALVRCAACGDPLEAPVVFDPEAGGALHGRCGGGRPASPRGLLWLEALRRTPLSATPDLDVPPDAPVDRWLLSDFARHHLGRDLRSRRLLEDLAGLGSSARGG